MKRAERREAVTPLRIGSEINCHKMRVIVSFVFSVSFFIFPVELEDIFFSFLFFWRGSRRDSDYLGVGGRTASGCFGVGAYIGRVCFVFCLKFGRFSGDIFLFFFLFRGKGFSFNFLVHKGGRRLLFLMNNLYYLYIYVCVCQWE